MRTTLTLLRSALGLFLFPTTLHATEEETVPQVLNVTLEIEIRRQVEEPQQSMCDYFSSFLGIRKGIIAASLCSLSTTGTVAIIYYGRQAGWFDA